MGLLDIFRDDDTEEGIETKETATSRTEEREKSKKRSFFRSGESKTEGKQEKALGKQESATAFLPQDTKGAAKGNGFTNHNQYIRVSKPKMYHELERDREREMVGNAIKDNKAVILHLEDLDSQSANRYLEFVYGICFAFDIVPENIDSKIILIDPRHKHKPRG